LIWAKDGNGLKRNLLDSWNDREEREAAPYMYTWGSFAVKEIKCLSLPFNTQVKLDLGAILLVLSSAMPFAIDYFHVKELTAMIEFQCQCDLSA
jgi:hypothetical protein